MTRATKAGLFACVATAAWLASAGAAAQEQASASMKLGADGVFLLPVGKFADVTGAGLGAMARFEYALNPSWALTARAGFIWHTSKNDAFRTTEIPILAGAKMFFEPGMAGWYGAAEAGPLDLTFHTKSSGVFNLPGNAPGQDIEASEWKLAATVTVGYAAAPIDARAGLFIASLGDASESAALMASVGYDFASF